LPVVTRFAHGWSVSEGQRLRLVLYQEVPGLWVGRGIEHDITAEGRSIGEVVRAMLQLVRAHTAFDTRHRRPPLSVFHPAPQAFWNAFSAGTPVPLSQLGAEAPPQWEIAVAIAHQRPSKARLVFPTRASL
jgi:hypothetical protein